MGTMKEMMERMVDLTQILGAVVTLIVGVVTAF